MKLQINQEKWKKFISQDSECEIAAGPALNEQGLLIQQELKPKIDWRAVPIKEMAKYGWIKASLKDIRENAEQIAQSFFPKGLPIGTYYRRTVHNNSNRTSNEYALVAWTTHILKRAEQECCPTEYQPGSVNKAFMQSIAKLSVYDDGPLRAKDELAKHGISLIVEHHLSNTYLDGSAMLSEDGRPVIGMSIRNDRIDNFWFTLMHELAHVSKHLETSQDSFIDDIENGNSDTREEIEANRIAGEVLIPRSVWNRCEARIKQTPELIMALAKELGIHPAIIAGRIRKEENNYKILNDLVGHRRVRRLFDDVIWD